MPDPPLSDLLAVVEVAHRLAVDPEAVVRGGEPVDVRAARVPAVGEDRALRSAGETDRDARFRPLVVEQACQPALVELLVADPTRAVGQHLAVPVRSALV